MKKLLLFFFAMILSVGMNAQGNSTQKRAEKSNNE